VTRAGDVKKGNGKRTDWLGRVQAHGFCSPQKMLCTPGRSPGFEVHRCRCQVSSFPGMQAEWTMATHLRLQWRDRTGIAPDFPFKPLRAPWVCNCCTTPGRLSVDRATWRTSLIHSCLRFWGARKGITGKPVRFRHGPATVFRKRTLREPLGYPGKAKGPERERRAQSVNQETYPR